MKNFSFYNPTKILFGEGRIQDITGEIPKDAKILLTYGGGSIKRNGIFDEVMKALPGYHIIEFVGIEPNPTYENLMKCGRLCAKTALSFCWLWAAFREFDGINKVHPCCQLLHEGEPWYNRQNLW
jgi:NADP-dependent alcohol dehydrogenase